MKKEYAKYLDPEDVDAEPAAAEDLAPLAERLGAPLPADYAGFLTDVGGYNGDIRRSEVYIRLFDVEEVAERSESAYQDWEPFDGLDPEALLIIGDTGGDELFCLTAAGRYLHVDPGAGEVIADLGGSFGKFLKKVRKLDDE